MDEREFRVLIKHYFMKGKSHQETKEKLDKHYGESAPSIIMVYKWFQNFRCGHMSTSDAERSGRPVEATTPEIVHVQRRVSITNPLKSRGHFITYHQT